MLISYINPSSGARHGQHTASVKNIGGTRVQFAQLIIFGLKKTVDSTEPVSSPTSSTSACRARPAATRVPTLPPPPGPRAEHPKGDPSIDPCSATAGHFGLVVKVGCGPLVQRRVRLRRLVPTQARVGLRWCAPPAAIYSGAIGAGARYIARHPRGNIRRMGGSDALAWVPRLVPSPRIQQR
eukprot:1175599-Prorocentrum_minimum.AAC.3